MGIHIAFYPPPARIYIVFALYRTENFRDERSATVVPSWMIIDGG